MKIINIILGSLLIIFSGLNFLNDWNPLIGLRRRNCFHKHGTYPDLW